MDSYYEENEDILQASGYYLAEDERDDREDLELLLQSWEHRLLRAARETTQGSFLMAAMHRNGVFHE